MPEILISDFNATRVPSDFSLGDGSWNGDHDLSGSDLKIGGDSAGGAGATSQGGCKATFSALDLSSIISTGSKGYLFLRLDTSSTPYNLKLSLLDGSGRKISWRIHWPDGATVQTMRYRLVTGLAGLEHPPGIGPWSAPDGVVWCHHANPSEEESVDWANIVEFRIESIGGFSPQPFAMAFTLLKAFKA